MSLLQADGSPSPVERTLIKPPRSRLGPVTPVERGVLRDTDAIGDKYDTLLDRESAEELLAAKSNEAAAAAAEAKATAEADKQAAIQAKDDARAAKEAERVRLTQQREADRQAAIQRREAERAAREAAKPTMADKMIQSAARSAASTIGRQVAGSFGNSLIRGILGGLFKGR